MVVEPPSPVIVVDPADQFVIIVLPTVKVLGTVNLFDSGCPDIVPVFIVLMLSLHVLNNSFHQSQTLLHLHHLLNQSMYAN